MVQSSERISLWWAVMGSRVNAAGTEENRKTSAETVMYSLICYDSAWPNSMVQYLSFFFSWVAV